MVCAPREATDWKGWAGEKSKNEHVPIRRPKQLWLKSSFPATHLSKPLLSSLTSVASQASFPFGSTDAALEGVPTFS